MWSPVNIIEITENVILLLVGFFALYDPTFLMNPQAVFLLFLLQLTFQRITTFLKNKALQEDRKHVSEATDLRFNELTQLIEYLKLKLEEQDLKIGIQELKLEKERTEREKEDSDLLRSLFKFEEREDDKKRLIVALEQCYVYPFNDDKYPQDILFWAWVEEGLRPGGTLYPLLSDLRITILKKLATRFMRPYIIPLLDNWIPPYNRVDPGVERTTTSPGGGPWGYNPHREPLVQFGHSTLSS